MTTDSKSTITVPENHLEKIHRVHGEYQDQPARVALYETLSDALETLLDEETRKKLGE